MLLLEILHWRLNCLKMHGFIKILFRPVWRIKEIDCVLHEGKSYHSTPMIRHTAGAKEIRIRRTKVEKLDLKHNSTENQLCVHSALIFLVYKIECFWWIPLTMTFNWNRNSCHTGQSSPPTPPPPKKMIGIEFIDTRKYWKYSIQRKIQIQRKNWKYSDVLPPHTTQGCLTKS